MNKTHELNWHRNLIILAIGVFIGGIAFSEVVPFLSLYIDTLGEFNHQQLNFWSGLVFSGTFIVGAFISPLWGKLADKRGRKTIILISSASMSVVMTGMGLVTNVVQLFLLRMLQGFFAGYISNSNALVATQVPDKESGKALGTMTAAFTAGQLLGPFVGGAMSSAFSYRVTFFLTGALLLCCFIFSLLFVQEEFHPVASQKMDKTSDVIKSLRSPQLIFGLLLTTVIIQAATNSINPIVSLYVRQLMHGRGNYVFIAGVIAALPGIATFLAAARLGAWGDKIGTHKIILLGMYSAIVFFALTAFVQNNWQLGILRFLVGFSDACLFPQVQTMLTKNTPSYATGRIFSWNQSAMYIGNICGPLIGSTISGLTNYNYVFLATAALVVLNLVLFHVNVLKNMQR
ncbi:MAG: MFS transporter [Lactobacillus sp.]|jgi:DHA1 family multidrug resistance protein-like MFS transporter|nr:MFS transporter [Lactobacillus sp.]